jgi:hypothetical protein
VAPDPTETTSAHKARINALSNLATKGMTRARLQGSQYEALFALVNDIGPNERVGKLIGEFIEVATSAQRTVATAAAEQRAEKQKAPRSRNNRLRPVDQETLNIAAVGALLGTSDQELLRQRLGENKYVDHEKNVARRRTEWHERRLQAAAWLDVSERTLHRRINTPQFWFGFLDAVEQRLEGELPPEAQPDVTEAPSVSVLERDTVADADHHVTSRPYIPEPVREAIYDFASHVRNQLEYEQGRNWVSDPLPIKLHWSALDQPSLADHPTIIRRYFGLQEDTDFTLPTTVDGIAGLFHAAPSARLVILGRGGSGKTTLVNEFALALLGDERRRDGDPVPVVFRLSSWSPEVSLTDWMVEQLIQDHPHLKGKYQGKDTLAKQLVEHSHILPIFDGFDEIASPVRHEAIRTLNVSLAPWSKVVLTGRPEEYAHAITESGAVLTGAAVVVIDDLTIDDIDPYLRRRTVPLSPETAVDSPTRWDPVISYLRAPAPRDAPHAQMLRRVLRTPLMTMLAKVTYSEPAANPMGLLDQKRFPDTTTVSNHLLDAFVEARLKYPSPKDSDKSWEPKEAKRWLGFLATFLVANDTTDFAWWALANKVLGESLMLITVLLGGALTGLTAMFIFRWHPTLALALIGPTAFLALLLIIATAGIYGQPKTLSRKALRKSLVELGQDPGHNRLLGLSFDLENRLYLLLMMAGLLAPILEANLGAWSVLVLPATFILFYVALAATPHSATDRISPPSLLRLDRQAATTRARLFYVTAGTFIILTLLIHRDLKLVLAWAGLVLVTGGLMIFASAWGTWTSSGLILGLFGLVPAIRCMPFLEYAQRQGILRQAGGVYQFRHASLRDRVARHFVQSQAEGFVARWQVVRQACHNLGAQADVHDHEASGGGEH